MKAREQFLNSSSSIKQNIAQLGNAYQAREWLVENVNGMGYKEASHFLRNIGQGMDLAILDRHILRFLNGSGILEAFPHSLRAKDYVYYEQLLRRFAFRLSIPLGHLDFILWYIQSGR